MTWYKQSKISQVNIFPSSFGIHEVKIGKATIGYTIKDDGTVNLYSLRVPKKYRGSGEAKNALTEFTKWLDKNNLTCSLAASPLDKYTSRELLKKLYNQFGYEETLTPTKTAS
jgi:hypothetical protein